MANLVWGVGQFFDYTLNSLDVSSGSNDIIVMEQEDGSLKSTEFNVRFGKAKVMRPREKIIKIEVNGKMTDALMKMSTEGEAFWVDSNDPGLLSSDAFLSPELLPSSAPVPEIARPGLDGDDDGGVGLNGGPRESQLDNGFVPSPRNGDKLAVSAPPNQASPYALADLTEEEVQLTDNDNMKKLYQVLQKSSHDNLMHLAEVGSGAAGTDGGEELRLAADECAALDAAAAELAAAEEEQQRGKLSQSRVDVLWQGAPPVPPSGDLSGADGLASLRLPPADHQPAAGTNVAEDAPIDSPRSRASSDGGANDDTRKEDEDEQVGTPLKPRDTTFASPPRTYVDVDVERSLYPTDGQLRKLNLKEGKNTIRFLTASSLRGVVAIEAKIYLWRHSSKIIVSDIDGTVTRSDILGQILPAVGKDWTHPGICSLYTKMVSNGYKIMYLTARSVSQMETTKRYLQSVKQDGLALPDGPVFTAPDRIFTAFSREIITRKPHEFKIACLQKIRNLFPPGKRAFYAGFGNRVGDAIAYTALNIPEHKIFIIDPMSVVHVCAMERSYTDLAHLVDATFPPLAPETSILAFRRDASESSLNASRHARTTSLFCDTDFYSSKYWSSDPTTLLEEKAPKPADSPTKPQLADGQKSPPDEAAKHVDGQAASTWSFWRRTPLATSDSPVDGAAATTGGSEPMPQLTTTTSSPQPTPTQAAKQPPVASSSWFMLGRSVADPVPKGYSIVTEQSVVLGKEYYILHASTLLYLSAIGKDRKTNVEIQPLYYQYDDAQPTHPYHTPPFQRWVLEAVQADSKTQECGQYVTLRNVGSGRYANIKGGSMSNLKKCWQHDNLTSTHTQFCLVSDSPLVCSAESTSHPGAPGNTENTNEVSAFRSVENAGQAHGAIDEEGTLGSSATKSQATKSAGESRGIPTTGTGEEGSSAYAEGSSTVLEQHPKAEAAEHNAMLAATAESPVIPNASQSVVGDEVSTEVTAALCPLGAGGTDTRTSTSTTEAAGGGEHNATHLNATGINGSPSEATQTQVPPTQTVIPAKLTDVIIYIRNRNSGKMLSVPGCNAGSTMFATNSDTDSISGKSDSGSGLVAGVVSNQSSISGVDSPDTGVVQDGGVKAESQWKFIPAEMVDVSPQPLLEAELEDGLGMNGNNALDVDEHAIETEEAAPNELQSIDVATRGLEDPANGNTEDTSGEEKVVARTAIENESLLTAEGPTNISRTAMESSITGGEFYTPDGSVITGPVSYSSPLGSHDGRTVLQGSAHVDPRSQDGQGSTHVDPHSLET